MKKYLIGIGMITTFVVCILTITYNKRSQVLDREYQGQTTEVGQNDSMENAEQKNEVKDDILEDTQNDQMLNPVENSEEDVAERNKEKYGDIVQVIFEQNQEDISAFFEYYPDLWQRWIAFSTFDFTRDGQMEIICSYAYVETSTSIYYNFVYDMQGNKLFEFVSEGLIDLNIYKAEDDLHYYIYSYLLIGASHTVKIYQEVKKTESWDVEIKYVEWDTRDGKLINENSQDGYYIYSDFSQEEKDLFMKKNYDEGMNKLFWNKESCGTAEQVRQYSEIYKSLPAADPVEEFAYILSLEDGVIWEAR
ncbi:MAG: hypothetical protein K2N81_12980 [Acetatifactor sp.]|nr:hypothetical protein [Acetatifactor sp.]